MWWAGRLVPAAAPGKAPPMPKFVASGVDRESGLSRSITVAAADAQAAERQANAAGLMVETVREAPAGTESADTDSHLTGLAALAAASAGAVPGSAVPRKSPTLHYAANHAVRRHAGAGRGDYRLLTFWCQLMAAGAWLLLGLGVLAAVIGLFGVIAAVVAGATASNSGVGGLAATLGGFGAAGLLLNAVILIFAAAPLGVLAYGGLALRDVARRADGWRLPPATVSSGR